MPEMFTPQFACPGCGNQVRRYIGPSFPGCVRVVDVPCGGRHRCMAYANRLGDYKECFCGSQVHVTWDGVKTDMRTEKPHHCHWYNPLPEDEALYKPPTVHPETAAQLARGFAKVQTVKPKAPQPDSEPSAIPSELKKALDGFR